jgi:hypothetical protein
MVKPRPDHLRVALYGADAEGISNLRALRSRPDIQIECFFDDNPAVSGSFVDGVAVRTPAMAATLGLDAILICSPHPEAVFQQLARMGLAAIVAVSRADLDARFAPHPRMLPVPAASYADLPERQWIERRLAAAAAPVGRDRAARVGRDRGLSAVARSAKAEAAPASVASLALCTVCSNTHIAYARTLIASFLAHHPDAVAFVCLVDERQPDIEYPDRDARVQVIEARGLGLPAFESMAFRYTKFELNAAVKGAFLAHVFASTAVQQLIYLDPDILVFHPLTPVRRQLERHAIALVPHVTAPLDGVHTSRETDVLKAGVFNLGFLGLSRGAETTRFLDWWTARLVDACVVDAGRGLFIDQRWIDLVPALFDDYVVIRRSGLNVAHWNLHERTVALDGDALTVNGEPLFFFHFSGIDPDDLTQVSRDQSRVRLPERGALRALFELYRALLETNDYRQTRGVPYRYATFANGIPVSDALRRIYRMATPSAAKRFPRPFDTGEGTFFEWLHQPVDPGSYVTNLFAGLHATRDELRLAFTDPRGADAAGFVHRLASTAAPLYGVHPTFLRHLAQGRWANRAVTAGARTA